MENGGTGGDRRGLAGKAAGTGGSRPGTYSVDLRVDEPVSPSNCTPSVTTFALSWRAAAVAERCLLADPKVMRGACAAPNAEARLERGE